MALSPPSEGENRKSETELEGEEGRGGDKLILLLMKRMMWYAYMKETPSRQKRE